MWWVNPVPDGFLHHGAKGCSEAPVFGANLITLLHHLYRLTFGDRVQPTQAAGPGRDHRVGCQLQTVFGRDSVRSPGGRLEVEHATLGVEQINDPPNSYTGNLTLHGLLDCPWLHGRSSFCR
jgi:hypothetical protein